MLHKLSKIFAICTLISIIGCSTPPKTEEEDAAQMYADAKAALMSKDYLRAIDLYSQLESRYPFSQYAQQALFDSSYAYFKGGDKDSAISTADRFIKLYPRHKRVDYAYYIKGLANYHRNDGMFDKYIKTDKSSRDPKPAVDALRTFNQLITEFPDSIYIADASARITKLRSLLANHELHIAKFYAERKAYVATSNRAQFIIATYPETESADKAVPILANAYRNLGMESLARETEKLLKNQSK